MSLHITFLVFDRDKEKTKTMTYHSLHFTYRNMQSIIRTKKISFDILFHSIFMIFALKGRSIARDGY